jgi:hypothetical protein
MMYKGWRMEAWLSGMDKQFPEESIAIFIQQIFIELSLSVQHWLKHRYSG